MERPEWLEAASQNASSSGVIKSRALVRDQGRTAELREHHVEIGRGDLLDHSSLDAAVQGVDAVVHCAAFYFHCATSE